MTQLILAITHIHVLAVYVKKGLPFAWDLSLEKSADPYVFQSLYFIQCFHSFCSFDHLPCLYPQGLMLLYLT